MAEMCGQIAGMVLQPMVFETLGELFLETEKVVKSFKRMVAKNQDTPHREVEAWFWQRLSVDLQRSGHRVTRRPMGGR